MIDRIRDLLVEYRARFLGLGVILLLVWIAFLDSHSLYKRWTWHNELVGLTEQNQLLREEIERLRTELATDLTDEQIERIAREQYGMQRPGETVHPIESPDQH